MNTSSSDVLVVGAGTAGLIAANRLARSGASVRLLEANHQVGGLVLSIERQGFRFDAGCQSFESMGLLFPILERLGLPGEAGFHRVVHRLIGPPSDEDPRPGGTFDFEISGWDEMLPHWLEDAEVDPEAVRAMVRELARVEGAVSTVAAYPPPWLRPEGKRLRGWWDLLRNLWILPILVKAARTDFDEFVSKHLGESALARLLSRAGYSRADLLSTAGFYHAWFRDYWYPKGGTGAWVNSLAAHFEQAGGDIVLKSRVEKILVDGGRAVGVLDHRGRTFHADRILWTGSAPVLYGKALADHPGIGGTFGKRALKTRPGDPIISVYVGLDMPVDQLHARLDGGMHNFYFPDDQVLQVWEHPDDPDIHSKIWVQINTPIFHEPGMAPEGKSCLVVQAFSDARWMERWGLAGKPKGDLSRDAEYKAVKNKVIDELLATASQVVPELKDRVIFKDLGSPMSIVRFTGNTEGSTTGWSFSAKHGPMGRPFFRTKSGLPGLYTAGQWYLHPGGVPFAAFSGWTAAGRMM